MEIVVHSKKSLFQQKFQSNCTISTGIPILGVWCKKWSNWTSGVGQKNPNPTPPKNLRLLTTPQPCLAVVYSSVSTSEKLFNKLSLSMLRITRNTEHGTYLWTKLASSSTVSTAGRYLVELKRCFDYLVVWERNQINDSFAKVRLHVWVCVVEHVNDQFLEKNTAHPMHCMSKKLGKKHWMHTLKKSFRDFRA